MSIRDWLSRWIDPDGPEDISNLDRADGVAGEIPPMTDAQAAHLMGDIFRCCETCGYLPANGGHVLVHHPSGAHYVTFGSSPRVHTVYDHMSPLASEVEAWLAGGAR